MAEEIKAVKLKTRETEDTLYYKVQADECRKELNEAQHKLYNATQQIESMVEEKKSLMTTIVNKNKHILETENKETEDKLCYKDQADEYRKDVIKKEADNITSQRAVKKLQRKLRNVSEELRESGKRFLIQTNKLQRADQTIKELNKNIDEHVQDKETAFAKLEKLDKENTNLENQLRSNENEIELLNNSLETERNIHEHAMKWLHVRCEKLESELKRYKDAHFNLLLKLDSVHNYSKISIEESSLVDKTFIDQRIEDERAKEEHLAEDANYVINKFASAKDRHKSIKSFKKRIEKGTCSSPSDNQISSDIDSDIEYDTTVKHAYCDIKYCKERLVENNTTTNCHNKREKNTNVFNINMNIADSKVSFIDKTEEQMLRLNGGSSKHQAIEQKDKL